MHKVLNAVLLAASCLTALPAHAEEDEIVVTATRAATPARALPADITVIDADDTLRRGQTTLAQAIEETPGLGVMQSGGPGQQTSLFAGGANSNHTLVLFDGLRLNDPSTPGSAFDAGQDQINGVSRIEIVEGPMSAIFGSDAIGGVINLIPRHGGDGAFNARFDVGGGSFGTVFGAVGADGTVGVLRYAVTAEGYASEGYDLVPARIVTHTGDADGAETMTLTGVFDLALSRRLSLYLLLRHRAARADFDALAYEFAPPYREYRIDDPDLEIAKNDLSLARLGMNWALSERLSLRASAGGLDQEREQRDGGALTDGFEGRRRFADLTLNWQAGALASFDPVTVVAGIATEREEIDAAQGFGYPPPYVFLSAEQAQRGGFVTLQGRAEALTLTAAARVDDYEGFGAEATWRLGAAYDFGAARVYGAYGTSFRAPTLYERFASFGDPGLDPERGESWEIGADARVAWFGRGDGLELGALYRRSDIKDLIDFGPLTYENIDAAEIQSAELRVAARPLSWLLLRAGYVYTDARDSMTGSALLRRPEDAWTAAAEVTHGALSGRLSWRRVGVRDDVVYGDDSFSIGVAQTPAYALARLSLTYAFADGAEAYVAVDNALDETYEPVNGYAGAPRAVTVGLRLRHGAN